MYNGRMGTRPLRTILLNALAVGTASCASPQSSNQEPTISATTDAPLPSAIETATAVPSEAPAASVSPSSTAPVASGRYEAPAAALADCPRERRNVLANLKPAKAVDYAELRQRVQSKTEPFLAFGKPCATAADVPACVATLRGSASRGFGSSCPPGRCDSYLVVTDNGGATELTTPDDVVKFLGKIDTPDEALLVAYANRYDGLACKGPAPKQVGKAYQLTINKMISDCPIETADVTISISEDGVVRELAVKNKKKSGACVGRRPAGLRAPKVTVAPSCEGDYLAACAHLEAASVPAFERLERDLTGFGAPDTLVRKCARAVADERRHTRTMTRLARRRGASVPRIQVAPHRARRAVTVAIENAVEGCVRETFGVLVGMHQAANAADTDVRKAMSGIARDELRHAQLSWEVASWLETRLSPAERRRARAARSRAIEALREEVSVPAPAQLSRAFGLPTVAASLAMLDELSRTLWSDQAV